MTAAAKNLNRLQGRSLAFSNGVGQSLRRTGDEDNERDLAKPNDPNKRELIIKKEEKYE